jgi:hypothetical protein
MNNNNIKKKVHGYVKLPKDKYKFYDKYIEDDNLKKYSIFNHSFTFNKFVRKIEFGTSIFFIIPFFKKKIGN